MKKLIALLTAMVLIVTCLSGCGTGAGNGKSKAEADSDDVIVTVWSGDGGGQDVLEKLVDDWNASEGDKKNIFIDWQTVMDSQATDVAEQNDNLPEIVGGISATQIRNFVARGSIVPLTDLPGGEEFLKEFDQPGLEGSNLFDGKQYSVKRKSVTSALAYNKDLFKQAGIVDEKGEAKPPKTMAEVREAAKKITALGDDIYGFALPLNFVLGYTVGALTYPSYNPEDPSIKVDLDELTVTYPGYKDMYQWTLDLKEDGSVFPGAETLDNDTARAYFSSGIIGMIPACSWDVGVYTTQFEAQCDWDICEFPTLDGKTRWMEWNSLSGGLVVSKNALKSDKLAEATMEAYKFIYSLDYRTALFEAGIDLSSKTDVIEKADKSKIDPRFLKFAELVDDEYKDYPAETYVVEGDNWKVMFQKVWMGELTLDEAIKDMEKRSTAGLRKAVEDGTYDVARQKQIDKEQLEDYKALKAKRD